MEGGAGGAGGAGVAVFSGVSADTPGTDLTPPAEIAGTGSGNNCLLSLSSTRPDRQLARPKEGPGVDTDCGSVTKFVTGIFFSWFFLVD